MARPESKAIAGYFPSPAHLLPSFASTLQWPSRLFNATIVDPCAGDGEAIFTLRALWQEQVDRALAERGESRRRWDPEIKVLACELERERARALEARRCEQGLGRAIEADAFRLLAGEGTGSVLFLNPPYDTDPTFRRLESRFLDRFTRVLEPGRGVLLFLVPHYALEACAEHLTREYVEHRCWRLPDDDFAHFRQVLLVARRSSAPLLSTRARDLVLLWTHEPSRLEVLPERCEQPIELAAGSGDELCFHVEPLDVMGALDGYQPWLAHPSGLAPRAEDLIGLRLPTAAPPKPAHIALALSSGVFNGHRLEPNDPRRHPPILLKGIFERVGVPVSEKRNRDGEVTGVVEIDRPHLVLTMLRLDTYAFHTLGSGTLPTGSDEPAQWNIADVLTRYDRSLALLLGRQFEALHDPHDAAAQIQLPALGRRPFRVQSQAIQAALKLLASGKNPFLIAEVGTGKSTMALFLAGALSPDHHAETSRQLAELGFTGQLPIVRKTLVLAPPHLLQSWTDQAAAVLPEARVVVVRRISDLERDGEIYILSRETAKLGHAWRGLALCCPRCDGEIGTDAEAHAAHRARCTAQTRRPKDLWARLAVELATALATAHPEGTFVSSLAPERLRHWYSHNPRPEVPAHLLVNVLEHVLRGLDDLARDEHRFERHTASFYELGLVLKALADATGRRDETHQRLEALRASLKHRAYWLENAVHMIANGDKPEYQRTPERALEDLFRRGAWEASEPCNEPLYQALPEPRRYPLAKYIARYKRGMFHLVIGDEFHEYADADSAQTLAAHRLIDLPGVPTVVLTGSLMGGYASSLFPTFWALSADFRREFEREHNAAFVARYGYQKLLRVIGNDETATRGSHSDRKLNGRRVIGEAPGIHPLFLLRHLLPTSILVHKTELDQELPALTEQAAPILASDDDSARDLLDEYRRLLDVLLEQIRADRFDQRRAGRLLGTLVELPSYLDRCTDDLPNFEIRYPEGLGASLIAEARMFARDWTTPKEQWLEKRVRRDLDAGENVMIFLRHTGDGFLPKRLMRLLGKVTSKITWLDAKKVATDKRESWIDKTVIQAGVRVLLVNPNAVRTGLNNLIRFSTAIWYELDASATTYRQANGRLHRIGQTKPVTILTPYYAGTAQETLFQLVAKKLSASLQVDGLDLQAALEAAGAEDDPSSSVAMAMSLGQAVYRALGRG